MTPTVECVEEPCDEGMTLVEVLVAMALFAVVGSLLLGLALSTNDVTEGTRNRTGVAEETRTAMERITRELRQSSGLEAVTLPTVAAPGTTSFTFWTDFNGDGAQTNNATDPEVLTYRWNAGTRKLSLTAQTASDPETRPLLAAKVTSFEVGLKSSRWEYDADGNGSTTWQELDASAVGNKDGAPNGTELAYVDLLEITMTVADVEGAQTYRTQVDLRNRS
ncbi:PulJ/GspJ family protein [Nocardioides sp. MAHUQ-72]|uniref:PulJ/GspJ family protein n=1 Tax=unclassified Nocardioides TaxID=2615069 RepID=UPI0036207FF7